VHLNEEKNSTEEMGGGDGKETEEADSSIQAE